ncbi:MAG: phosphoserine phosphatase SerB [Sphingomonadales bacterium]|nr:MAG: phosphoserine phosphatase SerB [Sphingomonadales bacterium]
MLIARLIADPDQFDSGLETRIDAMTLALEEQGMRLTLAYMLEGGANVLHLAVADGTTEVLLQTIEDQFGATDVIVAHDEIIIPQLFISDMDSTMIPQECIDELADYAGIKEQVSEITERAMQGELDFESALRERVKLLAGLDEGAIQQCLDERITNMPGARILVRTLSAKGCRTVLVTGGFHHFADPVAQRLGFDQVVGNVLDVQDGKLTGGLSGLIVDSSVKRGTLETELEKLGEGAVSLATGDGANDVPMLQAAHYGVAYKAKPAARNAANGRIDRGDLTSILKLLGIPQAEWQTD